jgi:twinkle protein
MPTMKILSLNTQKIYDIEISKQGENQMPCPDCSQDRKKSKAKPFSFNYTNKVGYCNHCLSRFVEYNTKFTKKEYKLPDPKNETKLSDGALKFFENRGIFQETIKKMGIYSDTQFMPQLEKETGVICFPYYLDKTLINIKHRSKEKYFKLEKNAELIFYNINALKNNDSVIITEGEMDCLSYVQAGFENCISVPNGASGTAMEYLDNYIDLFDNKTIYLSVDNDLKGYELRNELLRRFGQERCKIIELEDCKDANEYIQKYGVNELRERFNGAKELPVKGIIDVTDNYDECYNLFVNGLQKGKTIGISDVDDIVTWELGRVAVVTGIPGHGKSEFVDYIAIKLCLLYGWKIGYFSPENYPFKYHFSKLSKKLVGKSFDAKYMSNADFDESYEYIKDNISFIYPEDDMSFENILSKATYLVKRHGIKQFIIDPYNKIEHRRDKSESETEYISRFLDSCVTFAKKYQVLFWIVAHPRKMNRKKDESAFEIPNLYDINGSSNFYNKCDYGLIIYRNYQDGNVQVQIPKVKFNHLGSGGTAVLKYNDLNGRYESNFYNKEEFDYKNWLNQEHKMVINPNTNFYEPENSEIPF